MAEEMTQARALVIDSDGQALSYLEERLQKCPELELLPVETAQEIAWYVAHEKVDLAFLYVSQPSDLARASHLGREGANLPIVILAAPSLDSLPLSALRLDLHDLIALSPRDSDAGDDLARIVARIMGSRNASDLSRQLNQATQELERRSLALSTLYGVGRTLATLRSAEALEEYILDIAVHLTMADEGVILAPSGNGSLAVKARCGGPKGGAPSDRMRVEDSLAAMVMRTGRPLLVANVKHGPDGETNARIHSLLNVPLGAQERPTGVLSVANKATKRAFENEDELVLSALADFASIALENAFLFDGSQQVAGMEVFRQTVATLSHHINNPLTALLAGIHALGSRVRAATSSDDSIELQTLAIIERKASEIAAVISVLQEITVPTSTQYWQEERMIDIEQELQQRLRRLDDSGSLGSKR